MNFEMNSAGAFLSAVRVDRKNKTPIDKIVDVAQITVHAEKDENGWTVEAFYPLNVIAKLFDVSEFPHGYRFKGNFYKCGDDTDIPHFGSWAPSLLITDAVLVNNMDILKFVVPGNLTFFPLYLKQGEPAAVLR